MLSKSHNPCFHPFSMMLLDGHQKNIIQMTSSLLAARSNAVTEIWFKRMVWLCNPALYGMKHLAITMMLLLGSTMTEIQV